MLILFQELLSQTREKQASTLSEISWRGRTMPIKVEAVRVFLLNLQESSKELEATENNEAKVSIYESLLKQCIDAQQALRDTLQEDPVSHFVHHTENWSCRAHSKKHIIGVDFLRGPKKWQMYLHGSKVTIW